MIFYEFCNEFAKIFNAITKYSTNTFHKLL